jgi:hypothetical protein
VHNAIFHLEGWCPWNETLHSILGHGLNSLHSNLCGLHINSNSFNLEVKTGFCVVLSVL